MIDALPPHVGAVWMCITDVATKLSRVNVPLDMIRDRTGLEESEVEDAVAQLGEVGFVAAWNPGNGLVATLTPLAAARLGLKLRRFEGRGGVEWMPEGKTDPEERRRRRKVAPASALGLNLDRMAGDAPRPDHIAEATETIEGLIPKRARRLPDDAGRRLFRPTIILTGCETNWCEDQPGRCSTCKGLPLSGSTFCLRCRRWGLDWLLARVRADERRAEAARAKAADTRSLAERHAGVA